MRANVVPITKKGDCKNVYLQPVLNKVFGRLTYNAMFQYFLNDDPISPKQSDFEPGDSCIYQLISINHKIYKGINDGLNMRGVSVS